MHERRTYGDGELILAAGSVSDSFHIIVSGRVEVIGIGDDGLAVHYRTLDAGDCFGEEGLLTGRPRTASLIASGNVEVVWMDRDGFQAFCDPSTDLMSSLRELVDTRDAYRIAEAYRIREALS